MNETRTRTRRVVYHDDAEGVRLLQAVARRRNCTVAGTLRLLMREEADRLGIATLSAVDSDGGKPMEQLATGDREAVTRCLAASYRRVALVSRNYRLAGRSDRWDLSDNYAAINCFCDQQGCDTILYALWTWCRNSSGSHAPDFDSLRNVKRIFLEECSLGGITAAPGVPDFGRPVVMGWIAGGGRLEMLQRFARSVDGVRDKRRFMEDLREGNRTVGAGVLAVCGETNICSTGATADPFGFLPWLTGEQAARGTNVLLNPIHNYMKRREMTDKRRQYSEQGYCVLSVWNWGRWDVTGRGEPQVPWTFYDDGVDRTASVQPVALPATLRSDLRIGIVDLSVRE